MPPAKKAPVKKAPVPVRVSARALTAFDEKFSKRFGVDSLRTPSKRKYRVVSTGSLTLDYAMGCGGYVVGRVTEIWGPEGSSKSTLSLIAIRNHQREFPDRLGCLIDMERTFDAEWAEKNGVDLARLRVVKPHSSEEVSDMGRMAIESGLFSVVVLDSVGGMVTQEEMDKEAEKASVGTAAKIITRLVKQAAVLCDDTQTTLIIVNQVRANLTPNGAETTTGGGFALKHVTTHRIRLRRTGTVPYEVGTGQHKTQVGFEVAAIVEKNKVAPPRRIGVFALFFSDSPEYGPVGIDRAREAYVMGVRYGIIENPAQGSYRLPGEEKAIRGEASVIVRLREDSVMLETVRREMLKRVAHEVVDEVPVDTDAVSAEEDVILDFSAGVDFEADVALMDQLRAAEQLNLKARAT